MHVFNSRKEHMGAQIFGSLSGQFCGDGCFSNAETLK